MDGRKWLAWILWLMGMHFGNGAEAQSTPHTHATIDRKNDHAWEILRQFPDSAETLARQTIQQSRTIPPYPKGLINGHTLLGIRYKDKGFLSLSMENYLEALKWAEEANDSLRISSCLNNIGVVYQLQENFEKAKEYFEASLQIEERLGNDPAQKSIRLFNIGEMHERLQQHDKAFAYYYQSLLIEEQLDNREGIFFARLGLGRMHSQRGNLGDGARELGLAEKKADSLRDPSAHISLQLAWGDLHQRAGDPAQAMKAYENALALARMHGFQRMEMDALEGLVQQHRASGQYDRAMALQDSFLTLVAVQNSATVTTRIAELQFRYELKKKEQEIAQLQEQEATQDWTLKRERNMRIYLLATLLLGAGMVMYRFRAIGDGSTGEHRPEKSPWKRMAMALLFTAYWVGGMAFLKSTAYPTPPAAAWVPLLAPALFLLHAALIYIGKIPHWRTSMPAWPRLAANYLAWITLVWLLSYGVLAILHRHPNLPAFTLLTDTWVLSLMPTFLVAAWIPRTSQAADPPNPNPNPNHTITPETNPPRQPIHFQAELGTQTLTLHAEEIIAVEAANNYSKFHYQRSGKRSTEMFRISIKNVEGQLIPYPYMLRCHRSFIINGHYLSGMAGGSRSEKLLVADLEIPLSRTFDQNLLTPYLPPHQQG